MEKLHEGEVKLVYKADKDDEIIVRYKDGATAGNGEEKAAIQDKGALNLAITTRIFEMLEENGIYTHYTETLSDTDIRARKATILLLEVIIRGISAGFFAKRYGVEEGIKSKEPIFELPYKDDNPRDPLMNEDHAAALDLVIRDQYDEIKRTTLKISDLSRDPSYGIGVTLVDFKIELGTDRNGNIPLIDEISPDTCRLWDEKAREELDKDILRRDPGSLTEGYQKVLNRI